MFQKLRVLVADDSQMMRTIISDNLRQLETGHIDVVGGGEEALSTIQNAANSNSPYHIAFLDWHMPDMTGMDVLIECRKDDGHKHMAIVMLTAEQEQSSMLDAIQNGATAYLIKPVSQEDLKSNIDKVLQWFKKNEVEI